MEHERAGRLERSHKHTARRERLQEGAPEIRRLVARAVDAAVHGEPLHAKRLISGADLAERLLPGTGTDPNQPVAGDGPVGVSSVSVEPSKSSKAREPASSAPEPKSSSASPPPASSPAPSKSTQAPPTAKTTTSRSTATSTTITTSSSFSSSSFSTASTPPAVTAVPTTVRVVTISSAAPSASASSSSSNSSGSSSSGPGIGPIIGIVAGALVGLTAISFLVSFVMKKIRKSKERDDPYESNPFDRDEFRRNSAMLPDTIDDDELAGGRGPPGGEMYEHHNYGGGYEDAVSSAHAGVAGMGATAMYGHPDAVGGPRPPTMFARHMNGPAAQMGAAGAEGYDMYGNPILPPMAYGGDPYSSAGVSHPHMSPTDNLANPYAHLDRGNSLYRGPTNGSASDHAGYPGRSGTPDMPNIQQTYAAAGGITSPERMRGDARSPPIVVSSPGGYDMYGNPVGGYYPDQIQQHPQQSAPKEYSAFARHLSGTPNGAYGVAEAVEAHHTQQESSPPRQYHNGTGASPPSSAGGLKVRNLTGEQGQYGHRPNSVASNSDVYGGVY